MNSLSIEPRHPAYEMPSKDEQSLINVKLPLKILHIRVIDWALTHNFASFLDIDRAAAKHLSRMDQVVYSAARFNLPVKQVRNNFSIYPTKSASKLHFFGDAYRLAIKLHRQHRYHLIFTDDPMWSGLVGYLLKRRFRLPLLVMCLSDYYSSSAWRRENPRYYLDYLFSLWMIRQADWIKAVSRQVAGDLAQLGAAPERLTVLPTLIRTGLFRPDYKHSDTISSNDILFVGRLEKQKGLPLLIRALAKLVQSGLSVTLTVAGEGSQRPKIEKLAQHLRLGDHVRLIGYQTHHQLRQIYRRHRFLILPSQHEGTPKVIIEAGLCGRPTIGTRVGGIPELIVPGKTGLLVPPGNVPVLATAIRTLLENPDRTREMGQHAERTYRRRFDFPIILTKLLQMYAKAAGQTPVT